MLTFVERSTIQYLNKRGFTNTAIGEIVGHHRDTVKKALNEPVFRQKIPRKRTSAVGEHIFPGASSGQATASSSFWLSSTACIFGYQRQKLPRNSSFNTCILT